MSEITNPSGGKGRCRRGDKDRGIPKFCKCGEEAVIKTSGTSKNPGRLFYCCPNGYEGIYDLKCKVSHVKGEMSELKADMVGLEKLVKDTKISLEGLNGRKGVCFIL
ncbi:hypothetical protein N665_0246s0010 [Sinapis alba]|nr:hypothetical protein N665_0246s0010 [Sinapis alba]